MIGVFLCLFVGVLVAVLVPSGTDDRATIRQLVLSSICFQGATIALVWRFVREHGMSWTEAFGLGRAAMGVDASPLSPGCCNAFRSKR